MCLHTHQKECATVRESAEVDREACNSLNHSVILLSPPHTKMNKDTHYLSIDIESVGDRFDHSVIAIGACFGPVDGSWPRDKLIKFRGNLEPLPGDTQDQLCIQEFWSKFPDVYAEIVTNAEAADVVMTKFLLFCQQLVALYEDDPNVNGKIRLVTDCPDLYVLISFLSM